RELVGTIGVSGTRRFEAGEGGAAVASIGQFGVGLLSTKAVSRLVELRSWAERESAGVLWRWDGGSSFEIERIPPRGARGTIVVVHFAPSANGLDLDDRALRRWVNDHVPFVAADVYLEGFPTSLTCRMPPWRMPTERGGPGRDGALVSDEFAHWARERG